MSCFANTHIGIYLIFRVMFSKKLFLFHAQKQLVVRVTTCCLYIWDWKTLILLLNLLVLSFLALRNIGGPPTLWNLTETFCKQQIWHIHGPLYCLWENLKKLYKYSRFLLPLVFYYQYVSENQWRHRQF